MRLTSLGKIAASALILGAGAAMAGGSDRSQNAERDCRPINGPYGYYANPWCHEWDSVSGYTWSLEQAPDGSFTTRRYYQKPQPRRDLR